MMPLLVVGYGNMARAILSNNSYISEHFHIQVTGRSKERIHAFITECGLQDTQALELDSQSIDISGQTLLLCTKPKGLHSFSYKGEARCVYSVMAGVSVDEIASAVNTQNIVRLMPNIASSFKQSATTYFLKHLSGENIDEMCVRAFIESFGIAVPVDSEELIESSIAVSGSSIAFLALVAEALVDSGVYEGLSFEQSQALVRQTFAGFAQVYAKQSPSELKYSISSPGGTTIAGLAVLEQEGVRGALMKAAQSAVQRARKRK